MRTIDIDPLSEHETSWLGQMNYESSLVRGFAVTLDGLSYHYERQAAGGLKFHWGGGCKMLLVNYHYRCTLSLIVSQYLMVLIGAETPVL